MIVLLLACTHVSPALYPGPVVHEPREIAAPRTVVVEPGGCEGDGIAPGWVADCDGIAISFAGSEYVELLEADLVLARVYLRETQDLAALDRQHAEREWALAWERARLAERDARLLRTVVPWAFGGGLVLGGAAAIGVLAASEEVRR